ncbi:hypothetical protein NF27_DA00150 [Candidatus Jidaibacter acanthamoeba]|uniref:Uncharacterized protein n=1 Tax=Candidatus Jidaibacter acanthamoebae TaxID=86105 RepID=A0A0C1N0B4_9RICK|nr:hypothetical protein [Candidatus Jidaibacter acanthamoeba]KIE05751.1 hypothetical protein NF27_DA00150 [Candidatus Jidaibacter acanthamoeba]
MQNELRDKYGYTILAIGRAEDEKKKTHAEGKIIDYLLFTEVLQNAEQPIYIGISKLC